MEQDSLTCTCFASGHTYKKRETTVIVVPLLRVWYRGQASVFTHDRKDRPSLPSPGDGTAFTMTRLSSVLRRELADLSHLVTVACHSLS